MFKSEYQDIYKLIPQPSMKDTEEVSDIGKAIEYHFGKDYIQHDFETFKPMNEKQKQAVDKIKSLDYLKTSLYIYSNTNRAGKSTIQAMLYRQILTKLGFGYVRVLDDAKLQDLCRSAYLSNDSDWIVDYMRDFRFIILKDLGKANINDDRVQPGLFKFFDYLFSNCPPKVIWICSNFDLDSLCKLKGGCWLDISSRIKEKSVEICLD